MSDITIYTIHNDQTRQLSFAQFALRIIISFFLQEKKENLNTCKMI